MGDIDGPASKASSVGFNGGLVGEAFDVSLDWVLDFRGSDWS